VRHFFGRYGARKKIMDKEKQRVWLIILFLVTIVLLFRYFPKAGYGLAAITLLVMLFKLRK
jgi:energy-coupling factor transporter transmembrane protein EcfT